MAQKKEQIRIEAEFDASKLSGKAKKAFDDLQRSTDKIDKSAKKATSSFQKLNNTVNNIGKASKSTTNTMVNNLRQVERQADKTSRSLDKLRTGDGGGHHVSGGGGIMGSGANVLLLGGLLSGRRGHAGPGRLPSQLQLTPSQAKNILDVRREYALKRIELTIERDFDALNALRREQYAAQQMRMNRNAGMLPSPLELQLASMRDDQWNKLGLDQSLSMIAAAGKNPGTASPVASSISPTSFKGRWGQMDFGGKMGAVGMAGMLLAPFAGSMAKNLGASDTGANLASNLFSGIIGGATGGSILGPLGSAGGALIGASAALVNAAMEQKRAAEEMKASFKSYRGMIADEKMGLFARRAARTFNEAKDEQLAGYLSDHQYDNASHMMTRRNDELTAIRDNLLKQIEKTTGYTFASKDNADWTIDPGMWTELRGRGDTTHYKKARFSVEEGKEYRHGFAGSMDFQSAIALIEKLDAMIKNNEHAIEGYGKSKEDYHRANREAQEAAAAAEAEEKAEKERTEKEKAEAKEKKWLYEYRLGRSEAYANDTAMVTGHLESSKNAGENIIGRLRGYKLTDSLVSVGGGRGYSGQMNGVAKATNDINQKMNKVISKLTSLIDLAKARSETYAEGAEAVYA